MIPIKKLVCYIFTIGILSLSVGCSNQSSYETQQLKDKIAQLEKSNNDFKTKELNQNQLLIQYAFEIPDKVRFIEKENRLLALPQESSQTFRDIQTNTLAKVIDRALVDDLTWIYIEIPVYDSLTNYKGWIKENDTVLYTKDKVQLVQSDVSIKAGAEVYKTFNFEDIKKTSPIKLASKDSGRLEEKYNGFCRISQAGGIVVWVNESSVIYPSIE